MDRRIKKLQSAMNQQYDTKLLVNQTQFYSEQEKRPITIISVRKAIPVEGDAHKRTKTVELFKSCSDIQILLFLRDMWYELHGWEIPPREENKDQLAKKARKESTE